MKRLLRIALFIFWSVAAATAGEINLLQNGDFSRGTAGWQFLVAGATATGQLDPSVKHDGKTSFKLTNKSAFAPNIYARITQTIPGLQPFATYKVSCWAKGAKAGLCWVGGGPGWYLRHPFAQGHSDWNQYSFTISTDEVADNYEFMVVTESPTEALWVADLRFELQSIDEARQAAVYAAARAKVVALETRVTHLRDTNNAYVRLGVAVANRFIDIAKDLTPGPKMPSGWKDLQLDEVSQVLGETEKLGPVNYNGTKRHFYYGYGHFGSIIDDLPNFPALGASLIQDGRAGPSSMNADGTLAEGALDVVRGLDRAEQFGMKTDFLLSPHYYPSWGTTPDMAAGNIGFLQFNLFHPKAKAVIAQWIAAMAERIKNKPALHSVCLANEPVYISSGRDPCTRPLFSEFLRQKHGTVKQMNELYGTSYKSFDDAAVPPPSMPSEIGQQRAYYDWTCFNKKMFADWHAWMNSELKTHGVKAPTHTKIMVFYTLDRDKLAWGVDPESMCHATDLAGCDAYAFPGGSYSYDWLGHEFFYDLLHSFRGQSVFNSENHLIPDCYPRASIPMNHSRSVIWQDGLHHEGSTTIWVWQNTTETSGLGGSIYFRPANIYGAGRAMIDLEHFAPEVEAINNARPRIGLLYSPPSIFWEEKYKPTIMEIYADLSFMGEAVTFVSERELADGTAPKVDYLVVPNATHVFDTTLSRLAAYKRKGHEILLIGKDSLSRDEYDRPLKRNVGEYPVIEMAGGELATAARLRDALSPMPLANLRTTNNEIAWGIEFRRVPKGKSMLVPLLNFKPTAQTVKFPNWEHAKAIDLLSGEKVGMQSVHLEPMLPRLLRIDATR